MRGNTKTASQVESSQLRASPANQKPTFIDPEELYKVWEDHARLRSRYIGYRHESSQIYMLVDLSKRIENEEKRSDILSVFHTNRSLGYSELGRIVAAGAVLIERQLHQREFDYLQEHHNKLIEEFESQEIKLSSEYGEYQYAHEPSLYQAVWRKVSQEGRNTFLDSEEIELANKFARIQQMALGEQLRKHLKDVPEPLRTSFEKNLDKIKELAYHPEKEVNFTLNYRVSTLENIAAVLFSLENTDQDETESVRSWKEKLKEIKGKEGYGNVIYCPPCIIREKGSYSTEGSFNPVDNIIYIPREQDDNSKMTHEHISLHELIHSHQDFCQLTNKDYQAGGILERSYTNYTPLLEGFTELGTQYIANGEVDLDNCAYPSYTLAAQAFQEALGQDNDWAIKRSLDSPNPARILESLYKDDEAYVEEGVSRAIYDSAVNKIDKVINEIKKQKDEHYRVNFQTKKDYTWNEKDKDLIYKAQKEAMHYIKENARTQGLLPFSF